MVGTDQRRQLKTKLLDKLRARLSRAQRTRHRPLLRYALIGSCCCAAEFTPLLLDKYRPDQLNIHPAASMKEADALVVAGPITIKMAPLIEETFANMPEPNWVVAFSACSCGGGPYHQGATVFNGVDTLIPVDVYVAGSPPRPLALVNALMKVQELKREVMARDTGGR